MEINPKLNLDAFEASFHAIDSWGIYKNYYIRFPEA